MSGPHHTPGPWIVSSRRDGDTTILGPTRDGQQTEIIRVYELWARDGGLPATVANANLIAAAPDLRAALKTAIGHIEHMAAVFGNKGLGYSFEGLSEDMPGIRAALAKAEGVPPRPPAPPPTRTIKDTVWP